MNHTRTVGNKTYTFPVPDQKGWDDIQIFGKPDFVTPEKPDETALLCISDGNWKCGVGCTPLKPGAVAYWDESLNHFYFPESTMYFNIQELNAGYKPHFHLMEGVAS